MSVLIDLSGSVARRARELGDAAARLASGDLDVRVETYGGDPLAYVADGIAQLQEALRGRQAERDREFLRLERAVQTVSTNIMIADNEFRIVFMNASIRKMFEDALTDIRKDFPTFDPGKLPGRCIDEFHRDPAHQRRVLTQLKKDEVYDSRVSIGGRLFDLHASAVFDESGNRVGSVVEWADRTADLRMEAEQQRLSAESARLRCAVENVSTNIMIADNEFRIVFLNRAVQQMFEDALSDIRKELPAFDPSSLLGRCIDEFHKRPEHQRRVLEAMSGSDSYKARIGIGGRTFDLTANPVFGDDGSRLGSVVEWYDRTAELQAQAGEDRRKAEMLRIKTALDNVSTNTMLCDENMQIVYMNKSILDMFRTAEKDIQKDLPNVRVDRLLGSNIDSFHKVPAHQRGILNRITDTYRSEIQIGGRTFTLAANPIVDEQGARHGAVVEWVDRTTEVQVEREISEIVNGAVAGDFSRRIAMEGKHAFFKMLAEAINRLIDVCDSGLSDVMRVLAAFSRGDLTERVESAYGGVFGELRDAANATSGSLQTLIRQIKLAVDTVRTAAEEIAAGNADLSQRTEEQASSLEETASSMEELTATVRQNAENATQANDLAIGAREVALKGGAVVQDVVATMSAINDSSRKIVEIISVIDGIAFQTNILALNAAVEAARAGEQGRGFAVVAGEVRNLAQRSAAAAKEIKTLIGGSVEKVEGGTRLVQQAGSTMTEIVDSVKRVTELIGHIAQASLEQSSGIEQVNRAVMQMDQITQQNAAVVEEAAAAAVSLEEQARGLSRTVSAFHVEAAAELPAAPPAPALAPSKSEKRGMRRLPAAHNGASPDAGGDWKTF